MSVQILSDACPPCRLRGVGTYQVSLATAMEKKQRQRLKEKTKEIKVRVNVQDHG